MTKHITPGLSECQRSAARRLRRVMRGLAEQSGQALVEFAIVVVVLLLLVLGIAQFGLALNTTNDETTLAGAAARYVAVNYNPSTSGTLVAWTKSMADTTFLTSGSQVCISFPSGSANVGDPVTVTVTTSFDWQPLYGLSQLAGGDLPSTSTLRGSATMRLEAVPSASLLTGSSC